MNRFEGSATESARKARSASQALMSSVSDFFFRVFSVFSVAQQNWVPAFAGMSGVS